jgi:hypothetical protein
MGGSRSGRYGSGRPIAEGLRRFDRAEYMRQKGNGLPVVGDVAEMKVGSIVARLRFTETATRFGGRRLWMLCPRCSRRCRVLFIGLAGSHAGVVSACAINRSRWIRRTERCTAWAKSPGKSIRKREWICQTSRRACTGAATIASLSVLNIRVMSGRSRRCVDSGCFCLICAEQLTGEGNKGDWSTRLGKLRAP